MVKLLAATKFHDIIGMLDTHLNQEEVDTMVKNKKKHSRTSMTQFSFLAKPEG